MILLTKDIRKEVVELANNCCDMCGFDFTNEPRLRQIHHRNGIRIDNNVENLQLLCAYCHLACHGWKEDLLQWDIERGII